MAGERTAVCAPARCVDRPTRGSDCGERLVLEASIVMAREPEVAGDHCRNDRRAATPDSKAFTRDSWDCWWTSLSGSLLALMRGRLLLSGTLMALTTIKPQMSVLAILYLLLWCA